LKVTAWSAVATASLSWGGGSEGSSPSATFDPTAIPVDDVLFDLGVQSGLTSSGVVLWTHWAQEGALVARVWRDDGAVVVDVELEPTGAFVKVVVEGLEPATTYRYAFVRVEDGVDVSRSEQGAVRTPPAPQSLAPLTVAATACTHPSRMPFEALLETANHDFDVLCHLGDISYNDDAFDTATYNEAWATTLGDVGYRAVLARGAHIPAIDDHEIVNNTLWPELDPAHYEAGLAAIFDHLPIEGEPGSLLWTSHRWGRTAEIFVLDSRTERHPEEGIYLSEAQLQWLMEGLSESPCHFKIVLNSVPIAALPPGWPGFGDRWEAFPTQRDALLDHITETGIENTWFLTGDLHAGLVHRVEGSGPRSGLLEIMVGPGGPRTLNVLPTLVEQVPDQEEVYFPSDQFLFRSDKIATTLLTFDPSSDEVRILFLDPSTGETLYDERLRSGVS